MLQRPEEGVGSCGTGVTGGWELPGQVLGTGLEFPMRETFHC